MSIRRVVVVAAIAALAGAATSAFSLASGAGRAASTQGCFDFTVVQPDPMAQFAAGTYHRQNFSPGNSLSCNTTFNIFRSYLYDPQSLSGWTVGPLTGSLRGQLGKRFVQKGTNNSVGFNIYRAGRKPVTKPLVRNLSLQPNTTRTYSVTVSTRIPDVGETVQLVNAAGAQILQSGYRISGANTVYFAQVQTPNLIGFNGQVRFTITLQS
jgi:hypothetical protein